MSEFQIKHYDNEDSYTVEAYDSKVVQICTKIGATPRPCNHDGQIFVLSSEQLLDFVKHYTVGHRQLTLAAIEARRTNAAKARTARQHAMKPLHSV